MTHVLVLHATLGEETGPRGLGALLDRLPYAKRLELERRDAKDRYASLAGIALALEGAAALRGRAVGVHALRFPAEGRPYLSGGPFFSVSHGSERVAAALSEAAEIGFDIEELGPMPNDADDTRLRLERWTATEAVLKAAGRGLRDAKAVELHRSLATATIEGSVFRLVPVTIAPCVVAHLASRVAIDSVTVEARTPPRWV
jgi:phosphopantetheinyl transferase